EVFRRAGHDFVSALRNDALAHIGRAHRPDELGVEAIDDRLGRAGGGEHALPLRDVEIPDARLLQGRHFGQARGAPAARHRARAASTRSAMLLMGEPASVTSTYWYTVHWATGAKSLTGS